MKKFILLVLFSLLFGASLRAQCDINTFKEICIKKIPEYFVYSKSFELTQKESKYEVIFNKLRAYILIADSYRTNIEIYRIEEDEELRLIKSSKAYLSYVPSVTGRYKIRFEFQETDEYCGAAVLSFLR
ncbi:MAG: hypothetical protein AAFU64_20585 [Bacteroidota bacterium]